MTSFFAGRAAAQLPLCFYSLNFPHGKPSIGHFFVPLSCVPFGIHCKITEYLEMTKENSKKNTEISARITRVLEIIGQNPNSFAKALGYGRAQTIYDVLDGKSAPSYDFFNRFAMSELSVQFDLRWILCGEGNPLIENGADKVPAPGQDLLIGKALEQAEEIGRLRERIRHLEAKLGEIGDISDTFEDFLEEATSEQSGAVKAG